MALDTAKPQQRIHMGGASGYWISPADGHKDVREKYGGRKLSQMLIVMWLCSTILHTSWKYSLSPMQGKYAH